MDSVQRLAQLFKDRNNPFHIYVATGTVVSDSPLQVQFGDSIVLTTDHLVVAKLNAEGFTIQYDDNGIAKTLTIVDPLQPGDHVILVPDADHKMWYLVGKVGTIA